MSRIMHRVTYLASCLIITCLVTTAHAEYTSSSALLNNLNQILRDPNKQMALTPDKSAVIFMSKRAEVSFGADCKMKLHDAGTYKRMTDLTKGFSVNMGEALGHRELKDANAVSCLVKLVQDRGMNWKLRPNGIGFAAKSYTAKSRPLDMWCSAMKLSVTPGGACTIKKLQRGTLGFSRKPVKRTLEGAPRRVTAVGRTMPQPHTMPQPRTRSYGLTGRTNFRPVALRPVAQSNFKLMSGGKRLPK
jgi:hypothetical protein